MPPPPDSVTPDYNNNTNYRPLQGIALKRSPSFPTANCNKSRDHVELLEKLRFVSSAQHYSTWKVNSTDAEDKTMFTVLS